MSALVKRKKIGLFGGTFDPVHEGHISLAGQVMAQCRLDCILFIPASLPPHKTKPAASFVHRVAMLEAALAGCSDMSISLIESERSSLSYTVDTVLELKKRLGPHTYFLIIGADSLVELHLWYRYEELLGLVNLIVAARPGISLHQVRQQIDRLSGRFSRDGDKLLWRSENDRAIWYVDDVDVAVSSSLIRKRIARHQPVDMVPQSVRTYIDQHGLYQDRQ
ncbi:MAG: nicotinate (nicotinamide) nucleotide adenylyltransferase [Desulfobulbaceae bacterium]|nr:nicotinate (nicotinamide) nucleotide adenylyltransferase [Desulfobulbaceae bacterium]